MQEPYDANEGASSPFGANANGGNRYKFCGNTDNVVLVDSRGDDYQNEHSYGVKCIAAAAEVATALFPAPQPEEPPRPTAQAKQKDRCHKLKVAVHAKKAHKRATSFYASELKKPKGKRLSADAISKIVKKEYDGHGPSGRSIQRYVNDNNNIGNSPIKMGCRGNIPKWA